MQRGKMEMHGGRTTIKVPSERFDTTFNPRRRFQFVHNLTRNLWKRRQRNYFPSLILQQKWHVDQRNVQVGDVVLVQDSNSLRGDWELAEVSEDNPGSDGKVRDVILALTTPRSSDQYTDWFR